MAIEIGEGKSRFGLKSLWGGGKGVVGCCWDAFGRSSLPKRLRAAWQATGEGEGNAPLVDLSRL